MKKFSSDCYSPICSSKAILAVCLIGFVFAFSCTSALYIPSSDQETTTASLSDLNAGRKCYIQKCAGCHTLYLPEKYTKEDWCHWVEKMALQVPLDSLEKAQILKYLNKGR